MLPIEKSKYQKQLIKWCDIKQTKNCVALNLTFKMRHQGRLLDDITATENYRRFICILSCKCFGSASKRYQRRIRQINVFEKKHDRWHTHGLMQRPNHIDRDPFEELIIESWKKTDWGNKEHHFDWNIDLGWFNYMTKLKSECDQFDFINYTWNC